jgi:membrane-associated phospholipid phosphatase
VPPDRRPLAASLTPIDWVHATFYAFALAVALIRLPALPDPVAPVAWYAAALLATLALARALRDRTGAGAAVPRAAFALVFAPVSFLMMGALVPYANPWHAERLLHAIDTAAFLGHNPNEMLDSIAWPPLTEVLQIDYALYYAVPVTLLASFALRRDWGGLVLALFLAIGCLYGSYVGYFFVPATGPNVNALGLYPAHFAEPMKGLFVAEPLRAALFAAETIKHDCFPSGHVALTLTCLAIARRSHRPTYRLLFVPVVLLVFGTVYLRYHYVVDVVFGVLLAVATMRYGPRLYERLRRRTVGYAPPPALFVPEGAAGGGSQATFPPGTK